MRFKVSELEAEFDRAHPKVQALFLYLDWHALRTLGHDLVITSVERTKEEYEKIYGAGFNGPMPHLADPGAGIVSHAVDFRTEGVISDHDAQMLVDHMNTIWTRDDGKPTALFHNVGAGPHVHVQAKI